MFSMFSELSRASFTDSSDGEDLDDIESMYEGQAQSILSSIDESIGKIDDFLAFDKSYVHGDIVFSVMNPSGQLGKVIDIDVVVDLENDHGKIVKDINSKELLRIRSFCTGDYVIHGPWLGVVDRLKELVTIVFDDGAICVMDKPDPALLTPVPPNLLEGSEYFYYPGQHVKSRNSIVFRNAMYLCGEWNQGRREGRVKCVDVQSVRVNWIVCILVGGVTSFPRPRCVQNPKGLTLLLPFPHANWQLGDYCIFSSENKQENHDTKVEGVHPMPLKCSNVTQKPKLDHEEAFVVVRRKVKVDVLWQDGSVSTGLDSNTLSAVSNVSEHEFWSEDVVLEKVSNEDGHNLCGKVGIVKSVDAKERTIKVKWMNNQVVTTAESQGKFNHEIVSAYEVMEHPDYCYFLGEIVCRFQSQSLEELKLQIMPDTVLYHSLGKGVLRKQLMGEDFRESSKSFLSCIGHVSGFKDGSIEVTWANGVVSKVGPHEIIAINREEEQASAAIPQNGNLADNRSECSLEFDNNSKNKNEKDVFDEPSFCSGINNFSNYSWEKDALSIPRAALGFLTNIASSIFGSRGSGSLSSMQSSCSSHLNSGCESEVRNPALEDENCSMFRYKPKHEDHHAAVISKHPQMPSDSTVLMQTDTKEFAEDKCEKVPLLRGCTEFGKFDKFDIIEDYSDHHFQGQESNSSQSGWLKKISQEWAILAKDLPDTIFVRVYEERADLLRAAIVGAAGTPYHNGLFFFDIFIPSDYPHQPPLVHYISGGLRVNPNLYESGHVCLSLLNTWTGTGSEVWNPESSTILQVLLSLQALVLNAKPYFNEAGYDKQIGKVEGEKNSVTYNENAFLLSCKSMLYLLRKPPKNFEALMEEHFRMRAQSILAACKAYIEGAQVGCVSEDGKIIGGDCSSSAGFKLMLAKLFPKLVSAFSEKGIECGVFINVEA